jgi:nucleoid-associated protein YgaU
MALRDKYQQAISTAQQSKMQGAAIEESGGKLKLKGTVNSVEEKNRIWNAIKGVSGWETEVVADIRVSEAGMAAWNASQAGRGAAAQTYTVKAGDTLSKIAKQFLGDANAYMEIFNANRDQLSDPNRIQPGQELKIPQTANR